MPGTATLSWIKQSATPSGDWPWPGTERQAASASRADVQAAVDAASDGDWVSIPNGSATWTSGIVTTKQIGIVAQNYTPTEDGTMTRNVTITNNAGATRLIEMTSGNSYHVGVGGIRFNDPNTDGSNHLRFNGSGSKVPLIWDCAFEVNSRFGTSTEVAAIAMLCTGGVMWNCRVDGTGFNGDGDPGAGSNGASVIMKPGSPAWNSASTMGDLDTNGDQNFYIEDSSLINVGQCPDIDDNGRLVVRYCTWNGGSSVVHGFTSSTGGRHIEYYNNTFSSTTSGRNISKYIWVRKGTGVFTDNVVNDQSGTGYTLWFFVEFSDNMDPTTLGTYPLAKQMGRGWNSGDGDLYLEPVYFWNNTGTKATAIGANAEWSSYVQEDRDYYIGTAKSGYTKYTYPHPMRAGVDAGPP